MGHYRSYSADPGRRCIRTVNIVTKAPHVTLAQLEEAPHADVGSFEHEPVPCRLQRGHPGRCKPDMRCPGQVRSVEGGHPMGQCALPADHRPHACSFNLLGETID